MTAWFILLLAGLFEITWACAMKYSNGFTAWFPTVITVAGGILSMFFLALAVKRIPLAAAYAIWTGIGTLGTTVLGAFLFRERLSLPHIACILLIAAGIAGLKLLTKTAV